LIECFALGGWQYYFSNTSKMNFREIWRLLKETVSEWQFNQVSLLASSLAYYTVFSLAPLMIIVITIVGAIFGEAAAKGEVVGRIQGVVSEQGARVIETAIANIQQDTTGGSFRLIFSLNRNSSQRCTLQSTALR
jgi:membrane protein